MIKRKKYLFNGKKYRTFTEIAAVVGKHVSNVSRYYKRHGSFEGLDCTTYPPVKVGFLSQNARNSRRSVEAYLKPCVCGRCKPFVENLHGWTAKTIRCQYCGREVHDNLIDNAILKWNKAYKEAHKEGFVNG